MVGIYMNERYELMYEIHDVKRRLTEVHAEQNAMRKQLRCMDIPYDTFRVGKDCNEGNMMFKSVAELALDNFNAKCDALIQKIKLDNIINIKERISDIFDHIQNNLNIFNITFDAEYLLLKEVQCEYEYQLLELETKKKEIEKTEKEIIKEQIKEEKKLQKEKEQYERKKANLQYKYAKEQNAEKLLQLQRDIDELDERINDTDYALSHNRCGYVYVVSNDDMKDGQYKIGITRRTVEERMKELGSGASHSFPMNVHGYVYCDDCFQVEAALHKHFANQRVNQVNVKKEWFQTTLEDITQAFKTVCDIDIELTDCSNEMYLYSKDKVDI